MAERGQTLLVIDDDDFARRMMLRALRRRGFTVEEACDGESGVEAVRRLMPDLVLLDLRMPGKLSGVDVAHTLNVDPSTAAVPVIVVSASTHADARSIMAELGCAAFIEKPVDFDLLYDAIDGVLGN